MPEYDEFADEYDQTFKLAREALEALKKHYPEYMVKTVVRQCTKFAQASSEGTPIFLYDRDSKGAVDVQLLINEIQAKLAVRPEARAKAS